MDEIELFLPSLEFEQEIMNYKNEYPYNPNGIEGTSTLAFKNSITDWLDHLKINENRKTVPDNRVPAIQYIAVKKSDSSIVGMLNLRLELNDYLLNYAGHIGYSVKPSERKKGYGSKMLGLALAKSKILGFNKILVTCADDNLGSIGVIENNKGVLEDERLDPNDGKMTRRYWISL
ncbi:GNAT family N-acetyltransferase [Bacillus mycoides]|uniref:GNAT family N-acetyltransferase n=1 Tax=Bacillus mycoides TaxID=1405 RepID=UPI0036F134A4